MNALGTTSALRGLLIGALVAAAILVLLPRPAQASTRWESVPGTNSCGVEKNVYVEFQSNRDVGIANIADFSHTRWCTERVSARLRYQATNGTWYTSSTAYGNDCATVIRTVHPNMRVYDMWGYFNVRSDNRWYSMVPVEGSYSGTRYC